jgi:glutathione S-transferase
MPITLYGAPMTRSLRVSWMLEELGLAWDYRPVDFSSGGHRSPEFLAINPAGKVPALRDGDLVLVESAAICLYLAERYGQGRYVPAPGTAASGLHLQWLSYIVCELEQPLWSMAKHKFALPREWRVPAMLETAPKEFDQAMTVALKWLPDEGCLLGAEPMVADILLAHTLHWAASFKLALPAAATAYGERLSARPQLARAVAREAAGNGGST